jgi:hypothetical protein
LTFTRTNGYSVCCFIAFQPNTKIKRATSKKSGTGQRGRPRKQAKENQSVVVAPVDSVCSTTPTKEIRDELEKILKQVVTVVPVVSQEDPTHVPLPASSIPGDSPSIESLGCALNTTNGSSDVGGSASKKKTKSAVKPRNRSRKVTPSNHLITEYFSVITRKRKTSKDLKEEEDRLIIYHLENDIDPISLLNIHEFEGKGRGIVATKPIARGTFICEYRGDLIAISDAKVRF